MKSVFYPAFLMKAILFLLSWEVILFSTNAVLSSEGNRESKPVLVVCPAEYEAALRPWFEYRRGQGYSFYMIREPALTGTSAEEVAGMMERIRARIRLFARQNRPFAILLVGDAFPTEEGNYSPNRYRDIIPSPRVPASVITRYGPEDHIASDSWYADLDNDGFPEIPIGRFPVRSSQELSLLIDRIINYETQIPDGEWQRRIGLVAGVGGLGVIIDTLIDSIVRSIFSVMLPKAYVSSFIQANWKSSFCPYPPLFTKTILSELKRGNLFWVYMGHGYHQGLDQVRTSEGNFSILEEGDLKNLDCRLGPPVILFFACYTGAIDSYDVSLAERMLLAPHGGIAVLAASRVSMPYALAVFGVELMDQAFGESTVHPVTLGELVCSAKRKMVLSAEPAKSGKGGASSPSGKMSKLELRELLDQTARSFDPTARQLDLQLLEHVHSINLLGDPLLRVRFPETIGELKYTNPAYASREFEISGSLTSHRSSGGPSVKAKGDDEVTIEIALPRGRSSVRKKSRSKFTLGESDREQYQAIWQEANQPFLIRQKVVPKDGHFSARFVLPAEIAGTHWIRILARVQGTARIGADVVTIRPFEETVPRSESGVQVQQEKNKE